MLKLSSLSPSQRDNLLFLVINLQEKIETNTNKFEEWNSFLH